MGIKILNNKKLYRDIVINNKLYRGSRDAGRKRNINYITSIFPDNYFSNKTVLDIGCAGGAICFYTALQGCKIATGIERDNEKISCANQIKKENNIGNVRFLELDIQDFLNRNKEKFDIVFALNILHHMENPFLFLKEISQIAQEAICIETPTKSIYGFKTHRVVKPWNQDYTAFMENNGFDLRKKFTSGDDGEKFYGGKRMAYLFEVNREKKAKLKQLEKYRKYREECKNYIYSNRYFLPGGPDNLISHLKKLLKEGTIDRYSNFLFLGPSASGKTHLYCTQVEKEKRVKKIFQYREKLDEFLNPNQEKHNIFSHLAPNYNLDEAIAILRKHPRIICIICFCDFNTHVMRLLERERMRRGSRISIPGYDKPLQYDYIGLMEKLARYNIKYFIVDTGWGHDTLYEKYYGGNPNSFIEILRRELDPFIYFLKQREFKKFRAYLARRINKIIKFKRTKK